MCWIVSRIAKLFLVIVPNTQEDFKRRVDAGEWDDLLISVPVKKGDFLLCSKWDDPCNW